MDISNIYCQSDFAHSFDFPCLTSSAKGIDLLCKASLWCVLIHKLPIYMSKSDWYTPLWWAKFDLEYLLTIFIYFNSKFKVTCKNEDFECRCIKTHFEEKSLKFVLFQSPFCFISCQNSLPNLPSWVVWSLLFVMLYAPNNL